MPAWLNAAGGLRYHMRGWRFSATLWQPFRAALSEWLSTWEVKPQRLLLVGPSAGYCIADAFLERFSAITVLEPDPIARFALGRRLARLGVTTELVSKDEFVEPLLADKPGLAERLKGDPELAVAFCNVLGQARFLVEDPDWDRFANRFRERLLPELAGRAWLSFHDRVSGGLEPQFTAPLFAPARLADQELEALYPEGGVRDRYELTDHLTSELLPAALPHSYFRWTLEPSAYHLIEAVACPAPA
jgi:hypothetical protein